MDLTEVEDIKRGGMNTQKNWWCDHSPRARHPRKHNQVDLRKHHYEQNKWRWWNSSWAISNAKRWCCESAALNMPATLETQQWLKDWKRSVFIPIPKGRQCQKCSNYYTIALISHASEVTLKILQAGFNRTWTVNFQMLKLDFEKAEELESKLPTSAGS